MSVSPPSLGPEESARRGNKVRLITRPRLGFLARRLSVSIAGTVLALVLAELGLRASIDHLPMSLADELASGYTSTGTGIYRFDDDWNMPRMRPHYNRRMFFNGYHWDHHSDWMGYRNPTDRTHADIVLIGDSMIYGHGVQETSTVRSYLERMTGRTVANLGVQGAAIDWEYEILKRSAVQLHPQYVFVFFLNNDISDLTSRLWDEEMRRFLELPVEDHVTHYWNKKSTPPSRNYALSDLYVIKAWYVLVHFLRTVGTTRPENRLPGQTVAEYEESPRLQLAMKFHLRALLKMKNFAESHGFHFACVFIGVAVPSDKFYEGIIGDFCRQEKIDFFSLRIYYWKAKRSHLRLWLPHDNHFTDTGARITAQALVEHFNLGDPGPGQRGRVEGARNRELQARAAPLVDESLEASVFPPSLNEADTLGLRVTNQSENNLDQIFSVMAVLPCARTERRDGAVPLRFRSSAGRP